MMPTQWSVFFVFCFLNNFPLCCPTAQNSTETTESYVNSSSSSTTLPTTQFQSSSKTPMASASKEDETQIPNTVIYLIIAGVVFLLLSSCSISAVCWCCGFVYNKVDSTPKKERKPPVKMKKMVEPVEKKKPKENVPKMEFNFEDKKQIKERKKPSGNQKKSPDKKTKPPRKRPSAHRRKKSHSIDYVEVRDPSIEFLVQQKPVRGYQLRAEQFTHKGPAVIPRFMNVDISKPPDKSDKAVEDSNAEIVFSDSMNQVFDIGSEVEIVTNERRPQPNVPASQPTHATVANNNLNPLEKDAKSIPRSEQRSQSNRSVEQAYDDPARFNEIRVRKPRHRDSSVKSDHLQLM